MLLDATHQFGLPETKGENHESPVDFWELRTLFSKIHTHTHTHWNMVTGPIEVKLGLISFISKISTRYYQSSLAKFERTLFGHQQHLRWVTEMGIPIPKMDGL